jgi:hypothetical protein
MTTIEFYGIPQKNATEFIEYLEKNSIIPKEEDFAYSIYPTAPLQVRAMEIGPFYINYPEKLAPYISIECSTFPLAYRVVYETTKRFGKYDLEIECKNDLSHQRQITSND